MFSCQMDPMNPANPGGREVGLGWTEDNATEVEFFRHQVDEICTKVNNVSFLNKNRNFYCKLCLKGSEFIITSVSYYNTYRVLFH